MTESTERLSAALADRYRILDRLGEGGMAVVYLAEDLRHKRQVAVKVLKPELAAALGTDRFLREIQVAAQLQHPHILPLHDSGEADGFLYYVMPYVRGESLRERLARESELPIAESVKIVREVVDALSHAHSQGVVHRDIKPDNIMISGRHALVMDFGVAKAVSEATGRLQLTTAGVALGTPAYMAPEQATADPNTDHRADIYAVGAVAYELLTGDPPFTGKSPQMVLAAHVTEAPEPVSKRREKVSPSLEQLVMRCLEKKPADRWQSAEEMLPQLELLSTPSGGMTPAMTAPVDAARITRRTWIGGVLATSAVALMAVLGYALLRPSQPRFTVISNRPLTRGLGLEFEPAISPDGREVAFLEGTLRRARLMLQDTEGSSPIALVSDTSAWQVGAAWTEDGRRILFWNSSPGGLFTVSRSGGSPNPQNGPSPRIASFGDTLIYASRANQFVAVIDTVLSADPLYVLTGDIGRSPHSPRRSPDGLLVAWVSQNPSWISAANVAASTILVARLEGKADSLVETNWGPLPRLETQINHVSDSTSLNVSPVWLPDSRGLLFVSNRDGSRDVYFQQVNRAGEAVGDPARITTGADPHSISISEDGTALAYSRFTVARDVWRLPLPSTGVATLEDAERVTGGNRIIEAPAASPDGTRLAYGSDENGTFNVYYQTLGEDRAIQLTRGAGGDFSPDWSPDGTEIAYHSLSTGARKIFVTDAHGRSSPRQVTTGQMDDWNPAWSPDGMALAFSSGNATVDLYLVERQTKEGPWGDPVLVVQNGHVPDWSPDGEWIVYRDWSEADSLLIVRRDGTQKQVLEVGVGSYNGPQWSRDGKEIYYYRRLPDGSSGIRAYRFETASSRLVIDFGDRTPDAVWSFFGYDGDNLYLSVSRTESDIWLLNLEWNGTR